MINTPRLHRLLSILFVFSFFAFLSIFFVKPTYAFNLSSLTYNGISYSALDSNLSDVFFKSDGTKMYVLGRWFHHVSQYTLSTPWDISTATNDSKNIDVSAQDSTPDGIWLKPDGTTMFLIGQQHNTVLKYTLSSPWDISTATYASVSFSVASQFSHPLADFFTDDGVTMYITGTGTNGTDSAVRQYTLSTPWDITSATSTHVFLMTAQDSSMNATFFTPDGTKMYALGYNSQRIFEYVLATPWNVSTATYTNVNALVNQDFTPFGLFFKPDGTRAYIAGYNGTHIYQYSLAPDPTPSPSPTPDYSPTNAPSSTPAAPPACGDSAPSAPDLFQINTTKDSAQVYFAPVGGVTHYYISYSLQPLAEQYGTGELGLGSDGVQTSSLGSLAPEAIYYVKVRGQRGCMPGNWSAIMKVTTNNSGHVSMYYK